MCKCVGNRKKREEPGPVLGVDGVTLADARQTDSRVAQVLLSFHHLCLQEESSKGIRSYKYGEGEIAALGVKLHRK